MRKKTTEVYQKRNTMSNTFTNSGKQIHFFSLRVFPLKYRSILFFAPAIFLLNSQLFSQSPSPDPVSEVAVSPISRDILRTVEDNTPLNRPAERAAWDALFRYLRQENQKDLDVAAETVGFIALNRQPVEYRGRLVRVTGHCQRCVFRPQPEEPGPFDDMNEPESEPKHRKGYFEAWVLVADRKDVPICVCLLDVPDGFPLGESINEPVTVTGFSYKKQLFLSADGEEVVTPTLLAKSLYWNPAAPMTLNETRRHSAQRTAYVTVATVILFWFVYRLWRRGVHFGPAGGYAKRGKNGSREPIRFDLSAAAKKREKEEKEANFDGVIRIPGQKGKTVSEKEDQETVAERTSIVSDEKTTIIGREDTSRKSPLDPDRLVAWFGPIVMAMGLSFGVTGPGLHAAIESKEPIINAEYTREFMVEMDALEWETLGDPAIPWEQQRDAVMLMFGHLRRDVSESFLRDNVTRRFSADTPGLPLSSLVRDPSQFRGKAFELCGHVVRVDEIPLDLRERNELLVPCIYRCRFLVDGMESEQPAEILTVFAPDAWKRGEPIRERAGVTGIFIKRVYKDENAAPARKLTPEEPVGIEEIFEGDVGLMPLLVASNVRWYPDTFLGNLGMDVGTLEQVPALKLTDLKQKELKVSRSLQLLTRNQILVRAFRITEHDQDAFYGLLQAARNTPAGLIEQEARQILKSEGKTRTSAVDLFNRPDETRGKPALLTGTAKRVLRLLVDDPEVQTLFGIDHYYEIQLFTKDSQRNPITVCVTSLPKGMPTGSDAEYNEPITVAAFPYKLWIYESSAELDSGDGNKPNYAPLLVGREPIWEPREVLRSPLFGENLPNSVKAALSFGIFAVLFVVWIAFRMTKRKRS